MVYHFKRTNILHGVSSQIHILCNGTIRYRLQFLMNHCQTLVKGVIRVRYHCFFTIYDDLSLIHLINAEKTFHKGRFSCAIFPHQRMDSSGTYFQVNSIQCLYAREAFTDPYHFQSVLFCHPVTPFNSFDAFSMPSGSIFSLKIGCDGMTRTPDK
jgi:hypothetical protein